MNENGVFMEQYGNAQGDLWLQHESVYYALVGREQGERKPLPIVRPELFEESGRFKPFTDRETFTPQEFEDATGMQAFPLMIQDWDDYKNKGILPEWVDRHRSINHLRA